VRVASQPFLGPFSMMIAKLKLNLAPGNRQFRLRASDNVTKRLQTLQKVTKLCKYVLE